jgi:hypothetical protein
MARSNDLKWRCIPTALILSQRIFTNQDPSPAIAILVFDASGEEHGRSDAGFRLRRGRLSHELQRSISKAVGDIRPSCSWKFWRMIIVDNLRVAMGLASAWDISATLQMVDEQLIIQAFL